MYELFQSPLTTLVHDPEFISRKKARVEVLRAHTLRYIHLDSLLYDLRREIAALKCDIKLLKGKPCKVGDGEKLVLRYIERDQEDVVRELDEEKYWESVARLWDMHEIEEEVEGLAQDIWSVFNLPTRCS